MLGFPGFDDPETIENQCAGQWVVCLTCHHSISVLGRPETRYWEEVFTPLYLVEGSVQHMHGDWGFSIRLAIQAGSCMITPRSVYWWSLFLCHCTQEHWNRLIARVFSNGADTSPQHKQTKQTVEVNHIEGRLFKKPGSLKQPIRNAYFAAFSYLEHAEFQSIFMWTESTLN